MPVYLDNAATANPKAPGVGEAMLRSLGDCNANPGHGGHQAAVRATLAVFEARATLARLLGVGDPARLIFTSGATAALNQAITGSLPLRGHVVCSTWEHNAVLRPLWAWRLRTGGQVTVLPAPGGRPVTCDDVLRALRPDTELIVLTAASNVTGVLSPIAEVGDIARRRGIRFVVDGSQVAGHLPLALDDLPLDLWACPGHKGLLGPQGIGLLYVRRGVEMDPLLLGGTGFDSTSEDPPDELPERYEAGTLNTPGILGLGAAAAYLESLGFPALRAREEGLQVALADGLRRTPGVECHATADPRRAVGVVSFRVAGWPASVAAEVLDARFGILARAGLHCAPLAHRALGTLPDGTVRFSVGPFTAATDVDAALEAVGWLAAHPQAAQREEAALGSGA